MLNEVLKFVKADVKDNKTTRNKRSGGCTQTCVHIL